MSMARGGRLRGLDAPDPEFDPAFAEGERAAADESSVVSVVCVLVFDHPPREPPKLIRVPQGEGTNSVVEVRVAALCGLERRVPREHRDEEESGRRSEERRVGKEC